MANAQDGFPVEAGGRSRHMVRHGLFSSDCAQASKRRLFNLEDHQQYDADCENAHPQASGSPSVWRSCCITGT